VHSDPLIARQEEEPRQAAGFRGSVALVTASLSQVGGGLTPAVQAIAEGLRARGATAHAYGLRDALLEPGASAWNGTPVHAFRPALSLGIKFAPALDRALAAARHDVLHLHGLWLYPSLAASGWRRRTGKPVIVSPHGMLDPWAMRHSGWKKQLAMALFERRNLESAACLHALNAAEADAIRALGLTVPIAVIPNGVSMPAAGALQRRPACFGGDDRKVLLFLGRLHRKKGIIETLEGWARALRERPALAQNWLLVIAGWDDGGHLAAAKAKAAALGITGHVRFPGPLFGANKDAALAHASAFMLASHSEGQPMSVLEAWAYGLPVFMTRACNLLEGFAAGAAVEIAPDPRVIAGALCDHLEDADLREIGRRGRELAQTRFTWAWATNALLDVYRWVTTGGPRPECVRID
jgi:poly(glycerol-phosphate) alpha-glucosyltransferase